jgi:hypothetical protein
MDEILVKRTTLTRTETSIEVVEEFADHTDRQLELFSDGEIVHTDDPHLHGPVGHEGGQPHVEGNVSDEADDSDPGDDDE